VSPTEYRRYTLPRASSLTAVRCKYASVGNVSLIQHSHSSLSLQPASSSTRPTKSLVIPQPQLNFGVATTVTAASHTTSTTDPVGRSPRKKVYIANCRQRRFHFAFRVEDAKGNDLQTSNGHNIPHPILSLQNKTSGDKHIRHSRRQMGYHREHIPSFIAILAGSVEFG
jgi:hypothetical protein